MLVRGFSDFPALVNSQVVFSHIVPYIVIDVKFSKMTVFKKAFILKLIAIFAVCFAKLCNVAELC